MASELAVRLRTTQFLNYIALLAVAAAGWYFLVETEYAMRVMRGEGFFMELMWMMMRPGDFGPYVLASFVMWAVMMIAMMVPAVMPMLIVYRKMERGTKSEWPVFIFAWGYLISWVLFSLLAALIQWGLHGSGVLGGELLVITKPYAAAILVAAGLYQLTPFKNACLERCRSPMGYFLQHFKPGALGAFQMGFSHGLFCIGCCWMLMALMFVGGAMSVLTMAVLSVFIVLERILPPGPWVSRIPGVLLIVAGFYVWLS